ncbi:MAG: PilZ domain-containing protein [Pseudomonadota bacterium]
MVVLDTEWQPLDEGRTILEALTAEVQEAAVQTAMIASWANHIARNKVDEATVAIPKNWPVTPPLYMPMARWQACTGLPKAKLETIDSFFRKLALPKKAIRDAETDATAMGLDRALTLHSMLVSELWRASAKDAQSAIRALLPSMKAELHRRYTQSAVILIEVLTAAAGHKSPCMDPAGQIVRPDLPQRRGAGRKYLGEDVILEVGDPTSGSTVLYSAHAQNISTGGMGVIRVPQIAAETPVTVFMPAGRSIAGKVAWYTDNSAGIHWVKELKRSDPLIASSS